MLERAGVPTIVALLLLIQYRTVGAANEQSYQRVPECDDPDVPSPRRIVPSE
jgi:hypothetical protein